MAKRTKAQLKTKVDQIIKPNGNREITPEKHNSIETDIIDSFLNAADGGFVIDQAAGYSTEVAINDDRQFASKKYVDDNSGGGFDPTQDYEFTGSNSFSQPLEIADGVEDNHAATVGQLDAAIEEVEIDESNLVHKSGDETITGVKTFSSPPVVPSAVEEYEAVNKLQMDTTFASMQNEINILSQSSARRFGTFANKSIVAFGSRSPNVNSLSNGTDTTITSKYAYKSVGNISEIQIYYLYSNSINQTTISNYDDATIECSIEYPAGTFTRVTFGGSNTKLMKKGYGVLSDTCKVYIPANTNFWIRTNVLVDSGEVWLNNRGTAATMIGGVGEGSTVGSNLVMSGTISNAVTIAFGPTAVLGVTDSDKGSVFIFGDSIMTGSTDTGQPSLGYSEAGGYVGRVFGDSWPILRCNINSQMLSSWQRATNPNAILHDELLSAGQFSLSNLGINDLSAGLSTVQSRMLSIWYSQKSRGIKIYQCTITPRTTSTDSWATVENQTHHANESTRLGVNNWIRDGAPVDHTTQAAVSVGTTGANIVRFGDLKHPAAGYFDCSTNIESSFNSGYWIPNTTGDGIHPNAAGYVLIVPAIDTNKFLL